MRSVGKPFPVVLICACVLATLFSAVPAQIPFIQVEFDDGVTTLYECPPAQTLDTLSVYAYNLNIPLVGVDLKITYPPVAFFWEDHIDATLWLGNSDTGLAIVWQSPQNGFEPVELFRIVLLWTGSCDCDAPAPHQGFFISGYPGNQNPTAVRWPDYAEMPVLGFYSLICADPPNPVQSTTWGAVKALYR